MSRDILIPINELFGPVFAYFFEVKKNFGLDLDHNHDRTLPSLELDQICSLSFKHKPEEVIKVTEHILSELMKLRTELNVEISRVPSFEDFYKAIAEKEPALAIRGSFESYWRDFITNKRELLDDIKGTFDYISGSILRLQKEQQKLYELWQEKAEMNEDSEFYLPKRSKKYEPSLNLYQTALLFNYLERVKIIQENVPAKHGGMALSWLTGHSHNTLSKNAISQIPTIKSDSNLESHNPFSSPGKEYKAVNLTAVKNKIEEILVLINEDILGQQKNVKKTKINSQKKDSSEKK